MTNSELLTASHVRYLLTLKRLNRPGGIRGSEIADELHLTRPSVHNMMRTFLLLKYIEKEPGGHICLTEYGLHRARVLEDQFHKIKSKLFFNQSPDETVDRAIYAMIAELSDACMKCLV